MEREFRRFHDRTGTTMLYITHDQAEAMALADRIAVMSNGRVLQFATPSQLYREPADAMVAGFVGEGMVAPAHVRSVDGDTCVADVFGSTVALRCRASQRSGPAQACLRSENLSTADAGIDAEVVVMTYEGGRFRIDAQVQQSEALLHFYAPEPSALEPGARVRLRVDDGWVIPQ
jgi:iron(III) transport system ATP-binding protein